MTGTKIVASTVGSRRHVVDRSLVILIILVWSGACAAEVLNPGFETTYAGLPYPRPLPQFWTRIDHPSFNSYCASLWYTEGQLSVAMFNRIGRAVNSGDFQGFYQLVDLTGIGSIEFDARLSARPEGAFEHFEASLLVDGVVLWSRNADGVYLNQQVDVSSLGGWRRVEIRNTAVDANSYGAAYWTEWDNVRLAEGPKTVPAVVDLDPRVVDVHLRSPSNKWMVCSIELPAGFDVNNIDETSVTLQEIPAYVDEEGHGLHALRKCKVTDRDRNGIPERRVKFDLDAVRAIVQGPEATLTVKGRLTDKTPFEGSATIKVVDKLAELRAKLERLKARAKDLRDKCKHDRKLDAEIKELQEKLKDAMDKYRHHDDKGPRGK